MKKKISEMTDEEYIEHLRQKEIEHTATIGDVISFLEENFRPDDKMCYMDCIEGMKNDCTFVRKRDLGDRFLYYVKKLKIDHKYVDDGDVVLI